MQPLLNFLGTGSCFNTEEGNTSAYFYPEKGTLVLIDCGESIFERVMKQHLLVGVTHLVVVITHMHTDHVGSLPSLLFRAEFMPSIQSRTVICECKDDMQTFFNLCGHPSANILSADECKNRFHFSLKAVPAKHGDMKASSFIFHTSQGSFYYSGDTEMIHPNLNEWLHLGKLDMVYHEASILGHGMHTPLTNLEEHFDFDNRKKVVCMHIPSKEDAKILISKGFEVASIAENCPTFIANEKNM